MIDHERDGQALQAPQLVLPDASVGDGDAASPRAETSQGIECAGVVSAIDARLHDQHALQSKPFVQCEKGF
jgi:hypothetical protein